MATATTATKTRAAKATAAPAEAISAVEEQQIEDANAARQTPTESKKAETESQKRNRLRNEAERVIINRYKGEFEDVATALFAENGLKFNKRMTEEQKAAAKIQELVAANPALRDQLLASLGVQAPVVAAPVAAQYPAPEQAQIPYGEYDENSFAADGPGNWTDQREGE